MVRNTTASTIISCHSSLKLQGTCAKRLHTLVQRMGDSIYWSKIFKRSKDPTLLFLATMWYALYAWDEAFEVLYRYINALVSNILSMLRVYLDLLHRRPMSFASKILNSRESYINSKRMFCTINSFSEISDGRSNS